MTQKTCTVEGCDKPLSCNGYCRNHNYKWKTYGDPLGGVRKSGSNEERFWSYVDKTSDCWLWTGALSYGYGIFMKNKAEGGGSARAHRFSYETLVGAIPEGLVLDHLCRNRACVNPAHLEPVTNKENILRGTGFSAQNAEKDDCPEGHPYDSENIYLDPSGWRQCKICRAEAVRKQQAAPDFNEKRREAREPSSGVRGKGAYQKDRTHCPQNHEYTEANTLMEKRKKPDGSVTEVRKCRTCVNAKKAAWRAGGGKS